MKQPNADMKARLRLNVSLSDELAVDNGVKHGDIHASTLFSVYFAVFLSLRPLRTLRQEISLRFRTPERVSNLRRFSTKSKTFEHLIRDLLYADDSGFAEHSGGGEDL